MKVVQITPYYPPSKGGIARFVSGLVDGIGDSADVNVIAREGGSSERVSVITAGKGVFILKALQRLRDLDPDVIHCHSHWHMLAPAVVYKRFHKNVKVIFTFHTEPIAPMKGAKSNIFGRLLKRCDAVTYVSRAVKDIISSQIRIQTNERVVHPGVHRGSASQDEIEDFKRRHALEGKDPILVFIGLLEWENKVKGVKILVEAVADVRRRFPNLKLLLVGDGSRRGEVERIIGNLDLSDNVAITGLVENVFAPLTLSDIYVHITLQEGLAQAILEAMSLGKPVIASNVGGIPEVVSDGENGILVDTTRDAVGSAVEGLLKNRARMKQLGQHAKKHVESNFTWEEASKGFLELYTSH
ncbi:MAG: glycosyltransferase family 4 protein [Thermoplasmata archaeon]|nr:glycosyltransferase family 4 protein [Thermoplasmata archaeon]